MRGGGPIWLMGMMGAGKSSVGRVLAVRLARPFVDTDAEIERAAGAGRVLRFLERCEWRGWRHRRSWNVERGPGRSTFVRCPVKPSPDCRKV